MPSLNICNRNWFSATEDTNASTSCSNEMDSSNTDGIVEAVDLDKLPELLVEIAEKYNIDLTQPDGKHMGNIPNV